MYNFKINFESVKPFILNRISWTFSVLQDIIDKVFFLLASLVLIGRKMPKNIVVNYKAVTKTSVDNISVQLILSEEHFYKTTLFPWCWSALEIIIGDRTVLQIIFVELLKFCHEHQHECF